MVYANPPYDYFELNNGLTMYKPTTIKVDSVVYRYYVRSLTQRVMSIFDFELPKTWDHNYFKYMIFGYGHLCVFNDPKYGVIPQTSTLNGYNIFYQPTKANVTNTLINRLNMEIGKDCEIIKINPDFTGIMDIVAFYAEKLALLDADIKVNFVNAKTPWIIGTDRKSSAEALKKIFDMAERGEPVIIFDKNLMTKNSGAETDEPFSFTDLRVKENYLADKLLQDYKTIMAMFDAEIGIGNVNFEKKERLIVDEVNANNFETIARALTWLENLRESFEKVNKLFGLNLKVELKSEVLEDGNDNTTRDDAIQERSI